MVYCTKLVITLSEKLGTTIKKLVKFTLQLVKIRTD